MKKLLIATTNKGKIAEISDILKSVSVELVLPDQIALHLEVEENGGTYEENARLKAEAFCQASDLPALADDTGLEVYALDGKPGLHSGRFSSKSNVTDKDRRDLLLSKLESQEMPRAGTLCLRGCAGSSLRRAIYLPGFLRW